MLRLIKISWIVGLLLLGLSCSKLKPVNESDQIIPVDTGHGGTYQITNLQRTNFNEVKVSIDVNPNQGTKYSLLQLLWSKTSDFAVYDSVSIQNEVERWVVKDLSVTGLQDSTRYFFKLSLHAYGQIMFSQIKYIFTNDLEIVSYPTLISRGCEVEIKTNLPESYNADTSIKILLNGIPLQHKYAYPHMIGGIAPVNIATGTYKLSVYMRGITVDAPLPVRVLPGTWNSIDSLSLPNGFYDNSRNGFGEYTVAYGPTKSYLVGGLLFKPVNDYWNHINTEYSYQRQKFIWSFDYASNKWGKLMQNNPKSFSNATAEYFNNGIYMLSGTEIDSNNALVRNLSKVLKLDLGTMNWEEKDSLPYGERYSSVSSTVNNEFYTGLGYSWQNGFYGARNDFWNYNPSINKWKRLKDFPGTIHTNPTMVSSGNDIYVFCGALPDTYYAGQSSLDLKREFWKYNTLTDQWTQISLPGTDVLKPGEKFSIAVLNNKLYFFTSQRQFVGVAYYYFAAESSCVWFDPVSNRWERFSYPSSPDIFKVIYSGNNHIILQSDKMGYTETINNKTFLFEDK